MIYPILKLWAAVTASILILLSVFVAQSVAQGISAEGVGQDGVTSEGVTYDGTGTVQDSAADGDIKVIDVLESDAEVKAEKEESERGPKIRTFNAK